LKLKNISQLKSHCCCQAQLATLNATVRYERACGQLAAAKEMVNLAEQGYFEQSQHFDPAWQEMLNHSTMKVSSYTALFTLWFHNFTSTVT